MKNPLIKIRNIDIGDTSYFFLLNWKFSALLYMQGGFIIHPIILVLIDILKGQPIGTTSIWSITSLLVFISSLILIAIGYGYRIAISSKQIKVHHTFFLFPFSGIVAELKNVRFKEVDESNHTLFSIYMESDPWADMGFADWVQIKYQGKKMDIGDNENYQELFQKIKQRVEGNLQS